MQNDPVMIHDVISEGFKRIENTIREETAKMSEIIRAAVQKDEQYLNTSNKTYSDLEK